MPNLLPSRELSISYAGYVVGGDQANRVLTDIHMVEQDYEKGVVGFTFTIEQPTEALFAAECIAAEAAFRKPRQNLTVVLGAQTLVSWSQASSTGMNAAPHIEKWGASGDSGRARWYRIRVEAQLPADNLGLAGRQYSFVNVAYSPSRRRTVTISGTYTAIGGTSSRAQYEAVFDAYATSVLATLTGTYKKLEEPQSTADDANKILNFSVNYEETFYASPGKPDADLRGEQLMISRNRVGPGDTPNSGSTINRLVTLSVSYEAWFDKTVTTALESKWDSLLPGIVAQVQTILAAGLAMVDEHPSFDHINNKITAVLTFQGATSGGIVEFSQTVENFQVVGSVLIPVLNKDSLAKYLFEGPGQLQRTITQQFLMFRGTQPPGFQNATTPPLDAVSGKPLAVANMNTRQSSTPERRGINPYTIDLVRTTYVTVLEFYNPISAGDGERPGVPTSGGGVRVGATESSVTGTGSTTGPGNAGSPNLPGNRPR